MRRVQQNLGEKRVLLGSVDKKNNLRITYERLNIEEKAFISSTKFNRRQLLSRQNKLRQLQNNKGLNLETRPKTRANLPGLPRASDSVVNSYSNNLILPQSRTNLRSPGKGKRLGSLLTNHGSFNDVPHNMNKHNSNNNLLDFKNVSGEKRIGVQTPLKTEKSIKTDSTQAGDSGLHVGDIIAYSASFGKREKPMKGGSYIDREDKRIEADQISKQTGESKNSAFGKQTFWKNELNSSTSSGRIVFDPSGSLKNEDADSIEDIQYSDNALDDGFPANIPQKESAICGHESHDRLSKDIFFKDASGSTSEGTTCPVETKSRVPADMKTKESTCSKSFNLDSPQTEHSDDYSESESSTLPPLVSRTPSWNGTDALPALGRIRRGSFCDVKTFTSGKVLDLLSSCEVPSPELPERKGYGQFLEVDNENLKYCRYLRSVTPEAASTGANEASQIPHKYLPSKNIIIGHTKVNLLQ